MYLLTIFTVVRTFINSNKYIHRSYCIMFLLLHNVPQKSCLFGAVQHLYFDESVIYLHMVSFRLHRSLFPIADKLFISGVFICVGNVVPVGPLNSFCHETHIRLRFFDNRSESNLPFRERPAAPITLPSATRIASHLE